MKSIPTRIVTAVERRSEASEHAKALGDTVLVQRGHPRLLVMKCPCGCGEDLTVNIDKAAGKAWRFYRDNDRFTLYPSVWRDTGCGSHFIIWDGFTYLFDKYSDDLDYRDSRGELLKERVLAKLSNLPRPYLDIADELAEIPWSVLYAARALVKAGRALEGAGKLKGQFRIK